MANYYKQEKGINSFSIRMVAIVAMLCSMYLSITGNEFSQCLYWFSFTLFSFLLIEGFNKTSNSLMYLRRFIVFTVIAEIPFNLYTSNKVFDLGHQSVMITLFVGIICCLICKYIKEKISNLIIDIVCVLSFTTLGTLVCEFLKSDFAEYGILIIMVFYVSYNLSYPKLFELAVMIYYGIMVSTTTVLTITLWDVQYSIPIVAFALFATIFSWLYNEERGPNTLILNIVFYGIYPVSLIVMFILEKTII